MEGLIASLIECTSFDVADSVANEISTVRHALLSIGARKPGAVISATTGYLARKPHSKPTHRHRGELLIMLNGVLGEGFETEGLLTAEDIALSTSLAIQEMTASKDIYEQWQTPASDLLVTISKQPTHIASVMDALLQKLQPTYQPHCYILLCLGEIAINNPIGFVPFLSDVLSRIVPLLPTVKVDSLKCATALSLRKFSEAVVEYTAPANKATQSVDASITREQFAQQMAAAYDVLFTQWLAVKDVKTRSAVVEALGEMCQLIGVPKLKDEMRKLTAAFVQLYKKDSRVEPLVVTKGICRMLEAAVSDEAVSLDTLLEEIWIAIFGQLHIDQDIDAMAAPVLRNQNEVLRCFHVTSIRYADKLVYYLLQRLNNKDDRSKTGALKVLRHLINSSGPYVNDKLIILGLKPVLNDSSVKVRQQLAQLSIALADHGYLTSEGEGGRLMVDFLLRQLCIPSNWSAVQIGSHANGDVGGIKFPGIAKSESLGSIDSTNHEAIAMLRTQCGMALQTLTNSLDKVEQILWPYLFQYLCVESYTNALPEMIRSLGVIAARQRTECRLKLGGGSDNGELCSLFHPSLDKLWECMLPQLRGMLDGSPVRGSSDERSQRDRWEQFLLKLVVKTVETVNTEPWTRDLAAALGKQFDLYSHAADEKRFSLKCLGMLLSKVQTKQFVMDHLDLMFRSVNHAVFDERQGCAGGVGLCAAVHIDMVLTRLENEAKQEFAHNKKGFVEFLKQSIPTKSEAELHIALVKSTVLLCYGYVALHCPVRVVVAKLDTIILRFLTQYYENPKSTVVRQSLLHTADLIAQSVHPSRLQADYAPSSRGPMLIYIKNYIKSETPENLSSATRILAINAAASWVKLSPPLSESEIWALCSVCAQYTYSVAKAVLDDELERCQMTVDAAACTQALNQLYEEILKQSPSINILSALCRIVQPWLGNELPDTRSRAMLGAHRLLRSYYVYGDVAVGEATEFPILGALLGRFCPRFCDNVLELRLKVLDCVHWLLAIAVLHKGHGRDYHEDVVENILQTKERLAAAELADHLAVVNDVATIVESFLPSRQMQLYLTALFELVGDAQAGSVGLAAATLLRHVLTEQGPMLQAEAEKIFSVILTKLPEAQNTQALATYAELLQAFHSFAQHHFQLALEILERQTLPFSQAVADCWAALARDHIMCQQLITHLLAVLASTPPCEMLDGAEGKFATIKTLVALAGIQEVARDGEPSELLLSHLPALLTALLLRSGSLADTRFCPAHPQLSQELAKSRPLQLVQAAAKTLLRRTRAAEVCSALDDRGERGWADLADEARHIDAVALIGRCIAVSHAEWVEPLIDGLKDHVQSEWAGHRVVCAALLGECLRVDHAQPQADELAETTIALLMMAMADEALLARKLVVRGMGNVAYCSAGVVEQYIVSALGTIVSGLDDPHDVNDEICYEAMAALSRLVTRVTTPGPIDTLLISIIMRITPFFEKESAAVRSVAWTLFGNLARFAQAAPEPFAEQAQTNLTLMLLHLYDSERDAREATASACLQVVPALNVAPLTDLLRKTLQREDAATVVAIDDLDSYRNLISQCAGAVIEAFPNMLNFCLGVCCKFYSSPSNRLRSNAAYLTGYFLKSVPEDKRKDVSTEQLLNGFSNLLRDSDPCVRTAAAYAATFASQFM